MECTVLQASKLGLILAVIGGSIGHRHSIQQEAGPEDQFVLHYLYFSAYGCLLGLKVTKLSSRTLFFIPQTPYIENPGSWLFTHGLLM